ncbi:alanine aminotransferase 2-like [Brienomyrus brachyistius]|uniref:alanine aminotransferase 2-like n=1 Tax=Brienomyrus brachyistius TaxID=42636 RepID=UPI0020B3711E|nr:alanine aminotransferase 2-like [Brienomyrus brachyistius]
MFGLGAINPNVRAIGGSQQHDLHRRAAQIRAELQQGVRKPFSDVIDVSSGDSHLTGMMPLTFARQVIAVCICPALIHSDDLPVDVRRRAQELLAQLDGESLGSYTDSCGAPNVQRSVAEFITRRDGGVPASPQNIFICGGSQRALALLLEILIPNEGPPHTGVLTPVPTHKTFTMLLEEMGAVMVPYQLCEEQGWVLQIDELRRALRDSRGHCSPKVLYIINPGNPTGHVQTMKSIAEVIQFAAEEELFLLVDEVYQDTVHGDNSEFISYKKVLFEMGGEYSETVQMASVHSISKGYMGEGGLRAGYVELVNIDHAVMPFANWLIGIRICAPMPGQVALDIMARPPQPGDASYAQYTQEVQAIRETLVRNVRRAQEVLNSLPCMSCQLPEAGIFVFPRLQFHPQVEEHAKKVGVDADLLYSRRLLEDSGVCVSPGCECGQRDGTHHLRLCVLIPTDTLDEVLTRLTCFHLRYMAEFL